MPEVVRHPRVLLSGTGVHNRFQVSHYRVDFRRTDLGNDGEGLGFTDGDEELGSPLSIILWTTPATELTMTMTKNVHFYHYSIIVLSKMDIRL